MTALVVKMPAQTIGQGGGVQERRQRRHDMHQESENKTGLEDGGIQSL